MPVPDPWYGNDVKVVVDDGVEVVVVNGDVDVVVRVVVVVVVVDVDVAVSVEVVVVVDVVVSVEVDVEVCVEVAFDEQELADITRVNAIINPIARKYIPNRIFLLFTVISSLIA